MTKSKIIIQVLVCFILTFILVRLNISFELLSLPTQNEIKEISYNLFTINATMGGFAFTVLGMLYSFSSKEYIKALQGTNIIVNKAKIIMQTIIFSGLSGFGNLFLMVINYKNWCQYLFILSLLFLFFSFAFFIKSMFCIYNLIKNIHEYDKRGNKMNYKEKKKTESDNDTW